MSLQVKYAAIYFQDDWRLANKLTLNLGLRWDADFPHVLALNYQWQLPFGKGMRFASSGGWANHLVGGWVVSGITSVQSGTPISISPATLAGNGHHPFVAGVTFDEVWGQRIESTIGETKAPFAGLDDLIRMKRAAGRPKDLMDLEVLLKLRPS